MIDNTLLKAIRAAIKAADLNRVIELIDSNRDRLTAMTPFGTWLHVASTHGQLEIVRWLIAMGINVNSRGGIAEGTALNEAACEGHLDIVQHLISAGAELDVSEPERNPLFGAIHKGHLDIAKLLIDNGIDTSVQYSGDNMNSMDALAFARQWGREEIAQLLASK